MSVQHSSALNLSHLLWLPDQEAMRVRPVASTGTTRYTKRDMRLGGHLVPKGTLLDVPFDAVHHFPGNWADPDAFTPVRIFHHKLPLHSCACHSIPQTLLLHCSWSCAQPAP